MTILLTFLVARSDDGDFSHASYHDFHSNWSFVENHHEADNGAVESSQSSLSETCGGSGESEDVSDEIHGYENPFSGFREGR